jgi:hypothetical protein
MLALEQIIARELATTRRGDAEAHLATCARCRTRLVELERDTRRFASEVDVHAAFDALVRAAPAARSRYRYPTFAIATIVALAACALLVFRSRPHDSNNELPDARRKGGLGFEVIRRDLRGHVAPVASGDRLSPGEAIRFRVTPRERGFLSIVDVDAAHAVTSYCSSLAVEGGVASVVDGSIILDATLGPERIFAIVCDWPIPAPVAVGLARRALTKAGGDVRQIERIVGACHEASVLIEKVPQ